MFRYLPLLDQSSIKKAYNKLVDQLIPLGYQLKKLDEKGSCCGFTLCYALYAKENRREEFLDCFQFLHSLKKEINFNNFIKAFKANNNLWVSPSKESPPIAFRKVLQLLQAVSAAQKDQSVSQIGADLDKVNSFICHCTELNEALTQARIKVGDKLFIRSPFHIFYIEKTATGFYFFESNNFDQSMIDPSLLTKENQLAKKIIENWKNFITNNGLVAFSLLFITYGDEHRDIDDVLIQFEKDIDFLGAGYLVQEYYSGKLSRTDLADCIIDEIVELMRQPKQIAYNFEPLLSALNTYKNSQTDITEQTMVSCADYIGTTAFSKNISLLFLATYSNQFKLVQRLLMHGADINQQGSAGFPLFIAAANGYLKLVKLLLAQGANVNQTKENGASALFIAAQNGHLEIAKLLVAQKANVNQTKENGASALYISAQNGYLEIVKLLLAQKANVNQKAEDGASALYIAAQNGYLEIVKFLLTQGANVNQARENGASALYIAAQNGYLEIVKFLLTQGANVNQTREDGASVLFIAAQIGHLEIVKFLLTQGANVNQTRGDGTSVLFIAAQIGHLEIVKLLLTQKNIVVDNPIEGSMPILFKLAGKKSNTLQKCFLDQTNNTLPETIPGITPLHLAIVKGNVTIASLLIKAGANCNLTILGITPLKLAELLDHNEIAHLLKKNQLDHCHQATAVYTLDF